ncbi:hypothetical protein NC652_008105 [Populus alba x Populus x berolinensis]|nr:hypothetical protein NC652_008105 [Populus alba x Populus x berolinensis]
MAHPYPRGFLKGHAGTPTVVLGKVLSATAVTGFYLDGTRTVKLEDLQTLHQVLRTGQIDLSEFGINPSKYEWFVAPEPAMNPVQTNLNSLFNIQSAKPNPE